MYYLFKLQYKKSGDKMVVLSNELRNLLTEDSLNSIMNAGSCPNGHLAPESNVEETIKIEIPETNNDIQTNSSSDLNKDLDELKSFVKKHTGKYDQLLDNITCKVNDLVKGYNELDSKLSAFNRKLNSLESNKEVQQRIPEQQQVSEPKQQSHPRSVDMLPPELSIENIFNCNGKKFN